MNDDEEDTNISDDKIVLVTFAVFVTLFIAGVTLAVYGLFK